ncbi:MAG: hypothetical protein KGJ86_00025 [Chloroflexota bacterium]|nr:hypothetical protein [Chloroflexota bacterium]
MIKQDEQAAILMAQAVLAGPSVFQRVILKQTPYGKQEEINESVLKFPVTMVPACNGSGKTYNAAALCVWWLLRWKDAKVLTTSATDMQVRTQLWGEVHTILEKLPIRLGKDALQKGIFLGPQNWMAGIATNETVNFQGFHGGHVLFVGDEAPGLLAGIFNAIEGNRSGGFIRVLYQGNPVDPSGPFFLNCKNPGPDTNVIWIDAFDTPNLQREDGSGPLELQELLELPEDRLDWTAPGYENLTTRRWVRDVFYKWGGTWVDSIPSVDSPVSEWWPRVRGRFPSQSTDSLINLAWIEDADKRTPPVQDLPDVQCGFDPGGAGRDKSVLVIRCGDEKLDELEWQEPDHDKLATYVANACRPYWDRISAFCLDSAGIGYSLGFALRKKGLPVIWINAGWGATNPKRFYLLRSQIYWQLRERFRSGRIAGRISVQAREELSQIRWRLTGHSQVYVERKDEMEARGMPSPNHADAWALAFCQSPHSYRRRTKLRVGGRKRQ